MVGNRGRRVRHLFRASGILDLADGIPERTAAAAGIAAINSIGNLGGYFGPQIFGILKDATHSDMSGLLFLAACAVVSVVLVYCSATTRLSSARHPAAGE